MAMSADARTRGWWNSSLRATSSARKRTRPLGRGGGWGFDALTLPRPRPASEGGAKCPDVSTAPASGSDVPDCSSRCSRSANCACARVAVRSPQRAPIISWRIITTRTSSIAARCKASARPATAVGSSQSRGWATIKRSTSPAGLLTDVTRFTGRKTRRRSRIIQERNRSYRNLRRRAVNQSNEVKAWSLSHGQSPRGLARSASLMGISENSR